MPRPRSPKALINPKMLSWARETMGWKIEDLSKKLGISAERLKACEKGRDHLTMNQLRKLAGVLHQNLAIFFFDKPPKKPDIGSDFRRIYQTDQRVEDLTPNTYKEIFKIIEKRNALIDLVTDDFWKEFDYEWVNSLDNKVSYIDAATRIRDLLGISVKKQLSWKSNVDPFEQWRRAVENLGVMVFKISSVKITQLRGYVYSKIPLPLIIINNKDNKKAQIFTLVHELVHLFTNQSGYCNPYHFNIGAGSFNNSEVYANYVAGEVIVPSKTLLSLEIVNKHVNKPWHLEEIDKIASMFKVSRELIYRRLVILKKASKNEYLGYRRELEDNISRKEKNNIGGNYWTNYKSKISRIFLNIVKNAYEREVINAVDTSYLLSIKISHFHNLDLIFN
ncbi:MAG: ImmA/IrrE family metallo-endopeptidase [Promethearchaeota archaeon]